MLSTRTDLKTQLQNTTCDYTIIKLYADWCKPCKKIAPFIATLVEEAKQTHGDNLNYIEINVDDAIDIYAFFKNKRMLRGIPAVFLYKRDDFDEDTFYVPSECVMGTDEEGLQDLFSQMG